MPSASRLGAARLGAVPLAAGRGTRMGGPGSKLTLPFGDAGVVTDLDTPEAYRRASAAL